jgi:hypothetical protein
VNFKGYFVLLGVVKLWQEVEISLYRLFFSSHDSSKGTTIFLAGIPCYAYKSYATCVPENTFRVDYFELMFI